MLLLLPLTVGTKIPVSEPTWQVVLNLKDIVELVLAPVHSEETVCFLDSKISEHQHRFWEAFPEQRLIPKHHFLEHYPQLIKAFKPLVTGGPCGLKLNIAFLSVWSDIHILFETFFCPFQ